MGTVFEQLLYNPRSLKSISTLARKNLPTSKQSLVTAYDMTWSLSFKEYLNQAIYGANVCILHKKYRWEQWTNNATLRTCSRDPGLQNVQRELLYLMCARCSPFPPTPTIPTPVLYLIVPAPDSLRHTLPFLLLVVTASRLFWCIISITQYS